MGRISGVGLRTDDPGGRSHSARSGTEASASVRPAEFLLNSLPTCTQSCKSYSLFEMGGSLAATKSNQMSGNPVRIGDGCATVTGYKLPRPLATRWEGGSEVGSPKSGYRFGCARRGSADAGPASPSKRRMRPATRTVFAGFVEFAAFTLRLTGSEGFFVFRSRPGLSVV